MCKNPHDLACSLEANLHRYNIWGILKTCLGFGDLALTFKVTVELNRSNLSLCGGGHLFSVKTILVICIGVQHWYGTHCFKTLDIKFHTNSVYPD